MLYQSLGDMKMSQFIEIATGNLKSVIIPGTEEQHTDKEIEEATHALLMEYLDIIGVNASDIHIQLTMLKAQIREQLGKICLSLEHAGFRDDAIEMISPLGYQLNNASHNEFVSRMTQIIRKAKYDIDIIQKGMEEKACRSGESKKMDKKDFSMERARLMVHYKMAIDVNSITAEEYACIVRMYNNEMMEIQRIESRKQQNRR